MKGRWRVFGWALFVCLFLSMLYSWLVIVGVKSEEEYEPTKAKMPKTVLLVVLGNMPLDEKTPTLDTMTRVRTAVEYYNKSEAWMLFSGGPTAGGTVSEAATMAAFAKGLGVKEEDIILEERARTTEENAIFTASLLLERGLKPQALREVFIVSKFDHLEWAMPLFKQSKKVPGAFFENAKPLGCNVDRLESIQQMETFLKEHPDSKMVALRLKNLRNGIRGID